MIGKNTTPEWKPNLENRLTFPDTRTYLEVEYEKVDDEVGKFEIWTCYVVLDGDKSDPKTHFPICSYIKK